ncbi:MAG: type II toxin-antitoxin system Phd/YefM family antitoxin [Sporichthyaceae bacterium]
MAEQLAHRDLRNRSSEILRAVAQGASYEITNHGQVVALLIPVGAEPMNVRRAGIRRGFGEIVGACRPERIQDVLDELRAEG